MRGTKGGLWRRTGDRLARLAACALMLSALGSGYDRAQRVDHMRSLADAGSGGEGIYACGPASDWDCVIGSHQGAMMLAYAQVHEASGERSFLEHALALAAAGASECGPSTGWSCDHGYSQGFMMLGYARLFALSGRMELFEALHALAMAGPAGDSDEDTLRCGPGVDWDCGEGAHQGMMLLGYLKLWGLTGNRTYLKFAESLAAGPRGSASCPECVCGPQAGWDCQNGPDQALMMLAYLALSEASGNESYRGYARELGVTGSRECGPGADWDCGGGARNALMAMAYGAAFGELGDERFLGWMDEALRSGSWFGQQTDCGPSRGDFDCGAANDQGFYMLACSLAYELSGDETYLGWAERFGDGPHHGEPGDPSACGPGTDWDCLGAFDQALFILGNAALDGRFNDEALLFGSGAAPTCDACPVPGTLEGGECVTGSGDCTPHGCAVRRVACGQAPRLEGERCQLPGRCTPRGCVVEERPCPPAGTVIGGRCYHDERACLASGCALRSCAPGKGEGCDAALGCVCTPEACAALCRRWGLEGACMAADDAGACACCGVEGDGRCPPGCGDGRDGDCAPPSGTSATPAAPRAGKPPAPPPTASPGAARPDASDHPEPAASVAASPDATPGGAPPVATEGGRPGPGGTLPPTVLAGAGCAAAVALLAFGLRRYRREPG